MWFSDSLGLDSEFGDWKDGDIGTLEVRYVSSDS